ncbi:PIG-L family deacetylase [Chitinophagaceae bacterium MMS25-I14]
MLRKLFTLFLCTSSVAAMAQQVRPANATQIYHELHQLKNLTHVLYLAAHPDDENTRFLAWMVNDRHIRTAYLSLTRGDGGQNILGSEQGPVLGLIRTHELMEARKIDGAGQFFSRVIDFGFSKNSEETLQHWNAYTLTHDVSYIFRKFRPDVVICRFPPTKEAGHGQHATSAIIAAKAFAVSGDKMQYTEDFKYVQPWQPKRLLFNSFRFGDNNTTSEDQFKLATGQYNALLGMGYGELAGISRSVHKSQGAGTPSTAGVQTEYFKLVAGDSIHNSLFDGIDITWNRVGRKEIGDHIDQVIADYNFRRPEKSIAALLEIRKEIKTVQDDFWREEKLRDINDLILHCSGLMAELVTKQPQTVAGTTLPFALNIISRAGSIPVRVTNISGVNGDTSYNFALKNDSLQTINCSISIPAGTPVTEPYWMSVPQSDAAQFGLPNDTLLGLPEAPNNLAVQVKVKIDGTTFTVPVPLSYKKLDPLKGDVVEALRIVPDVSVELASGVIFTHPDGSMETTVRLHSYKDMPAGTLTLFGDNKKITDIPGIRLAANADTLVPIHFTVAQSNAVSKGDFYMDAEFNAGDHKYNRTLHLIQYNHLPALQYFTPPAAKVVRANWKVTAKRIGYIDGAGDYTAMMLRLAGLQVDVLKEADLADAGKLKSYDAIITGVRAVNVEKRMAVWMPALMHYVSNGGTLIMQYNTLQDLSTTSMGPYPFSLSSLRVTEEDAAVQVLKPKHKLLTYPNTITDADYKDWVQERGLNFPSKWDDHYETIFRMNDKNETPLDGSVLYTTYGKGHYIYTSLSLFRQLPAGNKGAIRLLMNMLSVGK